MACYPTTPPLSLGSLPFFLLSSLPLTSPLSSYFILSNLFHGASCVNNRDGPSVFSQNERKMPKKPGCKALTAHHPHWWSMALCLSNLLRAWVGLSGQSVSFCVCEAECTVQCVYECVSFSVTIAPCKYWLSWIATVSSSKANTACHALPNVPSVLSPTAFLLEIIWLA